MGIEYHPKPEMIVRGAGDRKGKPSVEAYVGEEINQFEQAFGNEAANNANQ